MAEKKQEDGGLMAFLKGPPKPGTPEWDEALALVRAAEEKYREAKEKGGDAQALFDEVVRLRTKYRMVEQAPSEDD